MITIREYLLLIFLIVVGWSVVVFVAYLLGSV